jgi:hypothetical protein
MTLGEIALLSVSEKRIDNLHIFGRLQSPFDQKLQYHRDMEQHAGRPLPPEIVAALASPEARGRAMCDELAEQKRLLRLKFTGSEELTA